MGEREPVSKLRITTIGAVIVTAGSLAFTTLAPVIAEAVFYLGLLVLVCLAIVQWKDIRRVIIYAKTGSKMVPLVIMIVCAAGFVAAFVWYRWPFGESPAQAVAISTPLVSAGEDYNLEFHFSRIWLEDIRGGKIHSFKSQVDVVNNNPFVLYVSRVSRFGSIEGHGSPILTDVAESTEIVDVQPNEAYMCISEAVPVALALGGVKTFTGEIGCELRFGKTRGTVEKTWAYKRRFQADVGPNGQVLRFLTTG